MLELPLSRDASPGVVAFRAFCERLGGVRDRGLEWVLVRPPRFVNRARAQPRVIRSGENGRVGHVSRRHLAGVVIDAAERADCVHQAIVVGS